MEKITVTTIIILGITANANASEEIFYKEAMLVGGYSNTNKITGTRGMVKNSLGIEWLKKFSNEYGDYMTANVQLRVGYNSIEDSRDAWGLEIHNAWLDYKLGLGQYLRIGHFDPEFGLEPVLDTHGTLFQTLAPHSIGYKKDWGIGYRTQLGNWDYSTAIQTGTGMSIQPKDNSFLLSSRIGTPQNQNFRYGFSALYGQVRDPLDSWTIPKPRYKSKDTALKKLMAIDIQYDTGAVLLNSEFAYGEHEGQESGGILLGADFPLPDIEGLTINTQGTFWSNNLNDKDIQNTTLALGFTYTLNSALTLRTGYFHDLYSGETQKERMVLIQLYYYGRQK